VCSTGTLCPQGTVRSMGTLCPQGTVRSTGTLCPQGTVSCRDDCSSAVSSSMGMQRVEDCASQTHSFRQQALALLDSISASDSSQTHGIFNQTQRRGTGSSLRRNRSDRRRHASSESARRPTDRRAAFARLSSRREPRATHSFGILRPCSPERPRSDRSRGRGTTFSPDIIPGDCDWRY
jgi:hypothetical protein